MWTKTMYQRPRTFRTSYNCNVGQDQTNSIPTNIIKKENEIILFLALPGFEKSEVEVKLDAQDLIISTIVKNENMNFQRQEFRKLNRKRIFRLPETVAKEGIDAKMENGILKIVLPKTENSNSKINIQ